MFSFSCLGGWSEFAHGRWLLDGPCDPNVALVADDLDDPIDALVADDLGEETVVVVVVY